MNTINTAIPSWRQPTTTSQLRQLSTKEIEEFVEYVKANPSPALSKNRRFEAFILGIISGRESDSKIGFYAPTDTIAHIGGTVKAIDSAYPPLNNKDLWNDKANENTIKTPFGEMRLSLKLDGFYYDLESLKELSFLDTYQDGFISSDDYFADKLILRGYDEEGNEIELNFLQVMGGFDLTELYNDKKQGLNNTQQGLDMVLAWREANNVPAPSAAFSNVALSLSGNSIYRAEVSYKQQDTKNTLAFFASYADKNGWIDFKNDDVAKEIFENQSLQLAYRKKGADGNYRLEKISIGTNYNKNVDIFDARIANDRTGMNTKMQNYALGVRTDRDFDRRAIFSALVNQQPINGYSVGLNPILQAQVFTDTTGLAYTKANVQKVKEGLEKGGEEFLNSLTDLENVTAMKLDKDNGTITLRFSSGRETTIALEDLYSDSGEFVVNENGERALAMSEAKEMSQEELNALDFDKIGAIFDDSGVVRSLKDWGITAIQKATFADGRFLSFVLMNADGMKFNTKELYNLAYLSGGWLDNSKNQADLNSESQTKKIAPKPLVYPNQPIDTHA